MRADRPSRHRAPGDRPAERGWLCELTATALAEGDGRGQDRAGRVIQQADSPEQAMIWMRMSVRSLVTGFNPDDMDRTFRWLEHGQWEAVMRLRAGEWYRYAVSTTDTRLEWATGPVLFLSVLEGAERPPDPAPLPDPPDRRPCPRRASGGGTVRRGVTRRA